MAKPKVITHGCYRKVVHGDRESWTIYLIVPRRLLIYNARKLYRISDRLELLGDAAFALRPSGYSGPGRAFACPPEIWKKGRRYWVIVQSGGLDI